MRGGGVAVAMTTVPATIAKILDTAEVVSLVGAVVRVEVVAMTVVIVVVTHILEGLGLVHEVPIIIDIGSQFHKFLSLNLVHR